VNNGENKIDELSNKQEAEASTAEEQRIRFHQLIKRVSDAIRSQGVKAREERTRLGGPNTRPLEELEHKVLAATLALAGQGELAEITARVDQGAPEKSGDSGVYFTLSKFEGEGFITSKYIRATETEQAKVLFKVTEDGESVLAKAELAEQQRNANPQTLSITMPAQLKEFVDNQIGSGRYSSISEYIRALIREDQKHQKRLKRQRPRSEEI
jgi:putative addiction module CopG family antidote